MNKQAPFLLDFNNDDFDEKDVDTIIDTKYKDHPLKEAMRKMFKDDLVRDRHFKKTVFETIKNKEKE